jgi:hypothetical protein
MMISAKKKAPKTTKFKQTNLSEKDAQKKYYDPGRVIETSRLICYTRRKYVIYTSPLVLLRE